MRILGMVLREYSIRYPEYYNAIAVELRTLLNAVREILLEPCSCPEVWEPHQA